MRGIARRLIGDAATQLPAGLTRPARWTAPRRRRGAGAAALSRPTYHNVSYAAFATVSPQSWQVPAAGSPCGLALQTPATSRPDV